MLLEDLGRDLRPLSDKLDWDDIDVPAWVSDGFDDGHPDRSWVGGQACHESSLFAERERSVVEAPKEVAADVVLDLTRRHHCGSRSQHLKASNPEVAVEIGRWRSWA
jgi:hypothetical protein